MLSRRVGAIPSELGWLVDELDDIAERLRTLEAPSGESIGNAVEKLKTIALPVTIYRREDPAPITAAASAVAAVATPVPDGYTKALVHVTASATLRSNEAAGVSTMFQCSAIISPVPSGTFYNQWGSVDGQKYGRHLGDERRRRGSSYAGLDRQCPRARELPRRLHNRAGVRRRLDSLPAMSAHACVVDWSPETGALVACTCGFALGPFADRKIAEKEARAHREAHKPPPTDEDRERQRVHAAAARERRRAAKAKKAT